MYSIHPCPNLHVKSHHPPPCVPQTRRARSTIHSTRCKATDDDSGPIDPQREAILARIQRAKQYKTQQQPVSPPTPTAAAPPSSPPTTAAAAPPSSPIPLAADARPTGDAVLDAWLQSTDNIRQQEEASFLSALAGAAMSSSTVADGAGATDGGAPSSADAITTTTTTASDTNQPTPPQPPSVDARTRGTGSGSADQAANFLQVVQNPSIADRLDPNLRPEQFTIQREALRREQEVEIITVDQNYNAGQGGYKPKVATWGKW